MTEADQTSADATGEVPTSEVPTSESPTSADATSEGPTSEGVDSAATAGPEPARDLEHEGDIAADYLEGLLDIADLDGDIDLDVENDRAMVSIVGDGLDDLVGENRRTLDALQELTRLAVLRETGERTRLMLDVGGARARRRAELVEVAEGIIARVRAESTPVRLSPMNPFERKVVHDAVAAAGLTSESEGVEPARYVVVSPPSA